MDDRDAVAEPFDDLEHVRGEEHSGAPADTVEQDVFHKTSADRVDAFEGFVEQEQLGGVDEGGRHRDAFSHAFGVFGDKLLVVAVHFEQGEEFAGPFPGEGRVYAIEATNKFQELGTGEVIEEKGIVRDEADLPFDREGVGGHSKTKQFDFAGGWGRQSH